jgi:hypothetical protein
MKSCYGNLVQTSDGGYAGIVTMNPTQRRFEVGNNIVNTDAVGWWMELAAGLRLAV